MVGTEYISVLTNLASQTNFDLMAGVMTGFPLNHGSLLYLLLFTSLLTVALSVLSVAPNDFASKCTKFAELGSFNNPNQKVLLDTQFYPSQTLVTVDGEERRWISLDFDPTSGVNVSAPSKVRKRES